MLKSLQPRELPHAHDVLIQLRRRNALNNSFREIVDQNSDLLQQSLALKEQVSRIQQELGIVKHEKQELAQKVSELHKNIENGMATPKIAVLQEELTSLLREKASDKQTIIALNEQVKVHTSTISRQADELLACRESLVQHKEALREKQNQVEENARSLSTTTTELLSKNVEIERQRDEIHKLQSENAQLLKIIKDLKEAEADKHNALVLMSEEVERKKRESQLHVAASTPMAEATPTSMIDALSGRDRILSFGSTLPTAAKCSIIAHERAEVHALAHNASGSMLLTGSDDRTVRLWDSRSGARLSSLEIAVKAVMCVAFSPDGNLGLAGSGDLSVRVWSLKTGRVIHTLTGHTNKVYTAQFMPDSRGAFSSGYDRRLKLWDLHKGLVVSSLDCASSCNDAAVSRDGGQIVTAHLDASLRFWDPRAGQFAHELSGVHTQPVTSVLFHPTQAHLVLTNARDDTLCLVDTRKFDALRTLSHAHYKNGVNWNRAAASPDGRYAAAGGAEGQVFLWDLTSGAHVATLAGAHGSAVAACSWGDNDQLASVEKEHKLVLWE